MDWLRFHWISLDLSVWSNMKWQHSGPDPDSERLRPKYATGSSRDPGDGLRTLFWASVTIIGHQKRHGASIIAFCLSNGTGIQPVRDTLEYLGKTKNPWVEQRAPPPPLGPLAAQADFFIWKIEI